MQSRDFCFWLQGFFELGGQHVPISADQAAMIRRHLDMVFAHEIAPTGVQARDREAPPTPVRPVPVAPPAPAPGPDRDSDPQPYPPPPAPMC